MNIDRLEARRIVARRPIAVVVIISARAAANLIIRKTPRKDCRLQTLAEANIGARVIGIPNEPVLIGVEVGLADADSEIVVIALRPTANESKIRAVVSVGLHIVLAVDARPKEPVIVDERRRLETEHECIIVDALAIVLAAGRPLGTVAVIGVLDLAVDLDAIGVFFERLRHHLSHLVARDVSIAEESSVAVAFDDSVRRELSDRVVRPMSARNVAEGISRRKRRRRRARDKRRRQKCR